MDPIADMLAQIANANHKFKENIDMPASKIKAEIARVLKEEGYLGNYKIGKEGGLPVLKINMKYSPNKERVIQGVRRVSKPSLRIYKGGGEIPQVQNGLGISILSTSHGVMSGQEARKKKIGGEVLCYVW